MFQYVAGNVAGFSTFPLLFRGNVIYLKKRTGFFHPQARKVINIRDTASDKRWKFPDMRVRKVRIV